MGLGIPPLEIKIVLESNPLNSTMLVGRLALAQRVPSFFLASSFRLCLHRGVLKGMFFPGGLGTHEARLGIH